MKIAPEIAFNHMDGDPDLEGLVRRRIEKLERYCDHISSCDVAIERKQSNVSSGSEFRVRVDIRIPPRHELVATHSQGKEKRYIGPDEAINRTFDAAERQVKEVSQRQQEHRG